MIAGKDRVGAREAGARGREQAVRGHHAVCVQVGSGGGGVGGVGGCDDDDDGGGGGGDDKDYGDYNDDDNSIISQTFCFADVVVAQGAGHHAAAARARAALQPRPAVHGQDQEL